MKTTLLLMSFFFFQSSGMNLLFTTNDNCTEWELFIGSDGSKSNLYARFCNVLGSSNNFFEIKNDNNLDAKLVYEINFKNGKKITKEVVIHHNDKARFNFGNDDTSYQSGVSSWKFDKIQYGECGSFNTPYAKETNN